MEKILSYEKLKEYKDKLNKDNANKSGKKNIRLYVGMATCGVAAGATEVCSALQKEIDDSKVKNVEIVKAGCMGSCYKEPTVGVETAPGNVVFYGNVTPDLAKEIVKKHVMNEDIIKDSQFMKPSGVQIALRNCGYIDPENISEYIKNDGYLALGKVISSMKPDDVIDEVIKSGLRGRGGGGFPTGKKWQIAASNESDKKYIVCNADEGDPGAFMDRSILEGDPNSVLEAMAIAGFAIGADTGYIYIRAEYPLAVKRLLIAISQAKELGLLGNNILNSGWTFDIEIRYGAGAFVCGEETSLIHSIEGERGEPTFKPPFPAKSGLWGKPTCVNNVETFANIAPIINKGSDWFASIGTEKSKGTKVFALAGKVNNVGLVEVAMGTTLREIVYNIGGGIRNGKAFKAVQTGGPSGGCITTENLDIPIDYDTLTQIGSMMGSGGMIVMDECDCMVNIAKFYLQFTMEESCGKCTACRIGNKRLYESLTRITTGKGTMKDLDSLKELGEIIKDTALCGLGQTSPNPILSTMKYFYNEYLEHVQNKKCPAGVCQELLCYEILPEKCTGCTACARVCPKKCIAGEVKKPHSIKQEDCIRCGACYNICKFNAIVKK